MAACLVGFPGSGKGTQGALLSRLLDIPTVVAGDLFRAESKQPTPRGRRVARCLGNGDEVEMQDWRPVIGQALASLSGTAKLTRGLLLDGVLRFPKQLPALVMMLREIGQFELTIIYLDVPFQVSIDRLLRRKRSDDEKEQIFRRLEWSMQWIPQLLAEARANHPVLTIDGTKDPDDVHRMIAVELISARDQLQLT